MNTCRKVLIKFFTWALTWGKKKKEKNNTKKALWQLPYGKRMITSEILGLAQDRFSSFTNMRALDYLGTNSEDIFRSVMRAHPKEWDLYSLYFMNLSAEM